MTRCALDGVGTHWEILIDEPSIPLALDRELKKTVDQFDQRFSRFRTDSEVSRINADASTTHTVSPELSEMLRFGLKLKNVTRGHFDPNIAQVLEGYGYDAAYSFKPDSQKLHARRGTFSVDGLILRTRGRVQLDLGGFGKGYLIDAIAAKLTSGGFAHFLINGGGDIYATTKRDDDGWRVALEYPEDPEKTFGVLTLRNESLAGSGVHRRRIRDFHHLLDAHTSVPIAGLCMVFALASSALTADGTATALFVSPQNLWKTIAQTLGAEYLVIDEEFRSMASPSFAQRLQRGV